MSDERNEAGQFTGAEEPKFGLAGLEHDAGYTQMPKYAAGSEPDEPAEFANAQEAADALAEQEQPAAIPLTYYDAKTGENLNSDLKEGPVETVSLERAANDLATYQAGVVDNRAESISKDFAAAIDQMRADAIKDNPELAKELGIDPPKIEMPQPDNNKSGDQAAATNQPDPFDSIEGLAPETREQLKTNPQLRSFLETNAAETHEALQSLKAAVSHNQTFGQAALVTLVPEFAQYPLEQWPAVVNALKQAGDPRSQQVENLLSNVAALYQRQQVLNHHEQLEHRQQFENHVKAEDARLIEIVGGQENADEANKALITYLADSGVPRDQQLNVIMQNPVLRTAEARQTVWKAARYDEIMNAPKAVASKPLPPVQKPGTSAPRGNSGPASDIQALQRQLDNTKSESQQLKIARQIINLRQAG